jgi:hypothetical protein
MNCEWRARVVLGNPIARAQEESTAVFGNPRTQLESIMVLSKQASLGLDKHVPCLVLFCAQLQIKYYCLAYFFFSFQGGIRGFIVGFCLKVHVIQMDDSSVPRFTNITQLLKL